MAPGILISSGFYLDEHCLACLMLFWWIAVSFHCCRKILGRGVGASRGMNRIMWRWVLIESRCWCDQGRRRDEGLRSAAIRRHTSRISVVTDSANLEKTGCFIVKIRNKCRVFRCTVNWARARLKTAFIASGAAGSSSFYAARGEGMCSSRYGKFSPAGDWRRYCKRGHH